MVLLTILRKEILHTENRNQLPFESNNSVKDSLATMTTLHQTYILYMVLLVKITILILLGIHQSHMCYINHAINLNDFVFSTYENNLLAADTIVPR